MVNTPQPLITPAPVQATQHWQIISASRRTDIPAFYSRWFMHRIREGYCVVANPFNHQQKTTLILNPETTILVFWTRWVAPLVPFIPELIARGYRFYVHHTLIDYPDPLQRHRIPLQKALRGLFRLAEQIHPERIIWRYDPIILTPRCHGEFHLQQFRMLAAQLATVTKRVVISFLDHYRKANRRLMRIIQFAPDLQVRTFDRQRDGVWLHQLTHIAQHYGLTIVSCSEERSLQAFGITPTACIDAALIKQVFHIDITATKDPHQRRACLCAPSRDIGRYTSCLFGCAYCYATSHFEQARINHTQHRWPTPML
jgi:hypothetical protein